MNWYYAAGGQQQGPVDDAQLDALIAAGTVRPDSLVWCEGMPSWKPLRDARPIAGGPGLAPPVVAPPVGGTAPLGENQVRCGECGGVFTRDNAIQYGSVWVCAACKPRFLQKLREGAPAGGAAGPGATGTYIDPAILVAQALARGPSIDLGRCLSRAWSLMTTHFWVLIGATAVNIICQVAAGSIPIIGYCSGPILQGPLLGGLAFMMLKLARREEVGFSESFAGFSNFVPLMLASLVMNLLFYIVAIPVAAGIILGARSNDQTAMIVGIAIGGVLMLAILYFVIAWNFTYLLIMDRRYDFWTAMNVSRKVVNKCWWSLFGTIIVLVLMQFVGVLALCVGMFVTLTLLHVSLVYAYEDIFQGEAAT